MGLAILAGILTLVMGYAAAGAGVEAWVVALVAVVVGLGLMLRRRWRPAGVTVLAIGLVLSWLFGALFSIE